jgi:uncharacterized protein YacL
MTMENISTQYTEVIDRIAAKLSIPAEAIVQAYSAHGVVLGAHALICFIMLILSIAGFVFSMRWIKKNDPSYDDFGVHVILVGIAGFVGIIVSSVVGALAVIDFVFWSANPQAYAVYTLLEKVLK